MKAASMKSEEQIRSAMTTLRRAFDLAQEQEIRDFIINHWKALEWVLGGNKDLDDILLDKSA